MTFPLPPGGPGATTLPRGSSSWMDGAGPARPGGGAGGAGGRERWDRRAGAGRRGGGEGRRLPRRKWKLVEVLVGNVGLDDRDLVPPAAVLGQEIVAVLLEFNFEVRAQRNPRRGRGS